MEKSAAGEPNRPDSKFSFGKMLRQWADNDMPVEGQTEDELKKVDWLRSIPFIIMHLVCLTVIWVGWSPVAVGVAAGLYLLRMFAITGFYHRYFSHRTFRTSRWMQFLFAAIASSSAQGGPLWWAAHHRDHHRNSDEPEDAHSPYHGGFLWSHMLWFMSKLHHPTKYDKVPDLAKFPELRFLNRYDKVAPVSLAVFMFGLGELLAWVAPSWGTNGWQMLVWGFFISTVVVIHATLMINSLTHMWGTRRYNTRDQSRNNLLLALITLGEGWHNNHHYYPGTVRQGFYWWEIDITYYILRAMSWVGLVSDLRPVPQHAFQPGESEAPAVITPEVDRA